MNRTHRHSRPALVAAIALGLGLGLGSGAADARERGQHAPRPAAQQAKPRGDYTRHTERQRTENGYVRRDTWQGENGRTASRTATVVNDRDAGVRTRDVEWVGPDGRTATRQDVTTKTDGGYVRESTMTGPAGQTVTRSATVVNDRENGTRTREAVTTLPDGRTRSLSDVTTRTDGGYTRETTVVNPNGGTVQRDVEATWDPETKSWTRDVSVERTPPASGD